MQRQRKKKALELVQLNEKLMDQGNETAGTVNDMKRQILQLQKKVVHIYSRSFRGK